MRYRVIQEHDRRYPIRLMCRALAVLDFPGFCGHIFKDFSTRLQMPPD